MTWLGCSGSQAGRPGILASEICGRDIIFEGGSKGGLDMEKWRLDVAEMGLS